jgi:hypothetical protein
MLRGEEARLVCREAGKERKVACPGGRGGWPAPVEFGDMVLTESIVAEHGAWRSGHERDRRPGKASAQQQQSTFADSDLL